MATKENKIKYVEIEVLGNKDNDNVIRGLLSGFSIENGAVFIRLVESNNSTLYTNMDCYSIVLIKAVFEESIAQTFGLATKSDKEKSIDVIKDLVLKLRNEGLVDKDGFIDITKYTNVPEKYLPKGTSVNNVFGLKDAAKKKTDKGSVTTATNIVNKPTVYVKPEKKITYIRRKTKKPSKEFLKVLRLKVKDIVNGVYLAKDIPVIDVKDKVKVVDESDLAEGWDESVDHELDFPKYGHYH